MNETDHDFSTPYANLGYSCLTGRYHNPQYIFSVLQSTETEVSFALSDWPGLSSPVSSAGVWTQKPAVKGQFLAWRGLPLHRMAWWALERCVEGLKTHLLVETTENYSTIQAILLQRQHKTFYATLVDCWMNEFHICTNHTSIP